MKIYRGFVDARRCDAAARRLNLEIARCGLDVEDVREWERTSQWWPSVANDKDMLAIRDELEPFRQPSDEWSGAQLLLQFPSETWQERPGFHVDEPQPGEQIRLILGVALSTWRSALAVQLPSGTGVMVENMEQGDVLALPGDQPHGTRPNRTAWIRYGIYFRLITKAEDAKP